VSERERERRRERVGDQGLCCSHWCECEREKEREKEREIERKRERDPKFGDFFIGVCVSDRESERVRG